MSPLTLTLTHYVYAISTRTTRTEYQLPPSIRIVQENGLSSFHYAKKSVLSSIPRENRASIPGKVQAQGVRTLLFFSRRSQSGKSMHHQPAPSPLFIIMEANHSIVRTAKQLATLCKVAGAKSSVGPKLESRLGSKDNERGRVGREVGRGIIPGL